MNKDINSRVLNKIKNSIVQIDKSAVPILFGSRARGDARQDSDWDILVLTDLKEDFNTKNLFRKALFETELEL